MEGKVVWQGRPSPWIYWKTYLLCALTGWLFYPLWHAWRLYRDAQQTQYIVADDSVSLYHERNSSRNRLLEFDRIEAVSIELSTCPSWLSLEDLVITPKNSVVPPLVFQGLADAKALQDKIQKLMQDQRKSIPVQEIRLPILKV